MPPLQRAHLEKYLVKTIAERLLRLLKTDDDDDVETKRVKLSLKNPA